MRKSARGPAFRCLQLWAVVLWLLVLSPFAVVILGAFVQSSFPGTATEQWAGGGTGSSALKWFGYVWSLYRGTLGLSVRLAAGAVVLCLLIGVPGGYALARSDFRGREMLEALVMLPLSLPGIALSIALLQAFAFLRGTWVPILAGHLLYTMPFMVRLVLSELRSFDLTGLEAAARTLGATFPQRLRWVVLPNLRHAMVSGSLLVFCVSFGEFNVSYLLNTPLYQTYPAALYATYTSNSFQVSSAATVIFLAVLAPALLALQWLGREREAGLGQGV